MRKQDVVGTWWVKALFIVAVLGFAAIASVQKGQDVNWDLRNYHIRDPYTVFQGRMDVDLDPASMQSYFNPTLDLPFYALSTGPLAYYPRLLAAVMGLPFGALILSVLLLSHRLFGSLGGFTGPLVTILAAGSAVTGAATLTQLGTTFNEVPVAALVVFGLLSGLPRPDQLLAASGGKRMALAGLLFGAAAGLKLTALIHAPAFCITLLFFMPFARWLRSVVAFSVGWAISFLLLAGWWLVELYARFGNPFFPMFNGYFRSPWYPPTDIYDAHFLPNSPLQWVFYPFWWLVEPSRINSDLEYRDPRLAFFLVAVVVALGWTLFSRNREAVAAGRARNVIVVYAVIAYGFWLYSFSIMRYGIVLEITGTFTVVIVLAQITQSIRTRYRSPLLVGVVAAVAIFYGLWTRPSDYGHIPYGTQVFAVDMSWTPKDTLFIAITGPTAYVTAFVPPDRDVQTIGFSYLNRLAADWLLTKRSREIVASHRGPIELLIPPDDSSMLVYLPMIGISPQPGACRQIASNLDRNGTKACEAVKLPASG